MAFPVFSGRVNPISVMCTGYPAAFHDDWKLVVPLRSKILLPLLVIACHSKSIVSKDITLSDTAFKHLFRIRIRFVFPSIYVLNGKNPVVVDYQRHICELFGIEVGNPFKHRDFISLILVYHRMCFSPFSQSICIDEIHLISVIETSGKSLDEFCIFLLKYRIIRIWCLDLFVADL